MLKVAKVNMQQNSKFYFAKYWKESYRLKVLPAEEIHKSILSVICIVLLIKRCHDRYDSTYNLPKVASLMMEERLGKGAKRTET